MRLFEWLNRKGRTTPATKKGDSRMPIQELYGALEAREAKKRALEVELGRVVLACAHDKGIDGARALELLEGLDLKPEDLEAMVETTRAQLVQLEEALRVPEAKAAVIAAEAERKRIEAELKEAELRGQQRLRALNIEAKEARANVVTSAALKLRNALAGALKTPEGPEAKAIHKLTEGDPDGEREAIRALLADAIERAAVPLRRAQRSSTGGMAHSWTVGA